MNVNEQKARDPDEIPNCLHRKCATEIAATVSGIHQAVHGSL